MIVKIKMNGFFNFVMRRKKVILVTTVLSTLLFVGVGLFLGKEEGTVQPKEENIPSYNSEFSVIVENKANGIALINLNTLKGSLTGDTTKELLEKEGVNLDDVDLSKVVTLFIRSTTGEYVYVRVKSEDGELVTQLTNGLYKLMVDKKISFYENKLVSVKSKPTTLLTEVRNYGDYYSATDSTLLTGKSVETVSQPKENYTYKALLGVVLGVIAGGIIGLFIDIMDRKIHAISYINTIFDKEVGVFNASRSTSSEISKRLDIYLTQADNRLMILSETNNAVVSDWVKSYEAQKVALFDSLEKENIEFADEAVIIINKDQTTINWLKIQYELLEDLGKHTYLIFLTNEQAK